MKSPPLEAILPVADAQRPLGIEKLSSPPRFAGLDVHKDYVQVAILDVRLNVVLRPRRVDIHRLEAWARENLTSVDRVVLEATGNAWHVVDQLRPLVA